MVLLYDWKPQHLPPIGLAMDKLYQESLLPSKVSFSVYRFSNDIDGRGKFVNSSDQLEGPKDTRALRIIKNYGVEQKIQQ